MHKSLRTAAVIGALALTATSCNDFLDVNTNPNAPQSVSANLYLSPMLHWMGTSPQYDFVYLGRYTQEISLPSTSVGTWDRMGYDPASDRGGQLWRDVYWSFGQNLVDMTTKAEAEQRWDLLGVAYVLKAWGWLKLTEMHGEIVVTEAFDQSKLTFNYDSQEYVYSEVQRLLDLAIVSLKRTDGAVNQTYLARTDMIYNGDRTKWLKFAYGLKAMALNDFSNKASYKPADVIAAVDQALASNSDDALLTYTAAVNDDRNFLGWTRNNIRSYRQTQFVVGLMDGTQLGAVDPRMSRILSPSPDGQYRGYNINLTSAGQGFTTATTPYNFFGYAGTTGGGPSRYIFDDRSKMPIMTYAQLQFIKAEAAYKLGSAAVALQAYKSGIGAHIDFVNARNNDAGQAPSQITSAERTAFLANTAIVPTNAADLTLTQIMSQKYIAQWAWAHIDIWTDLRRYHYTDLDPRGANQVFPGFAPPTNLYADNGGKVVQRIRPRYNSEYVWNLEGLKAIGGDAPDYQTKPLWITQP